MSLIQEIHEQPAVFARLIAEGLADTRAIASELEERDFRYIMVAARGTSDNAARYAQYLWGAHNRYPVALVAPSLFSVYNQPPDLEGALVVGISQSGESPDLLAVMEEARSQGAPTLAIVNHTKSPLTGAADHVVDVHAGVERAVAATKSYSAQLLAIAMLSSGWRGSPAGATDAIRGIPDIAAASLESAAVAPRLAARFADVGACAVLGRGFNRSTAFEWALKLQEVTYALAHPYSTADFRHGPIAVVESGFPVFSVAAQGAVASEVLDLTRSLRDERGADIVLITNRTDAADVTDHVLAIPADVPEWLSPIPAIIAGQLFTYHLGLSKGHDPDQPRGLTKITRTI